jgi:hypothetical protein
MPDTYDTLTPPNPPDNYDRERMAHSRLRLRLLSGTWQTDLEEFLAREIDTSRRMAWGQPDRSKCLFRNIVNQLSVLYDQSPIVSHEEDGAAEELSEQLDRAGLWSQARRLQVITVGLREGLYRLDPVEETEFNSARINVRIVTPDLVYGYGSADEPDLPVKLCEYRQRYTGKGDKGYEWCRDVVSIEDPYNPYYMILSGSEDKEEDLSEQFLGVKGGLRGDAYPYRYADGTPYLPYVLYHAQRSGSSGLFDPYQGSELVDGTLVVATLTSLWRHLVRDCSWPQRWCVGVRPAGGYQTTDITSNMAYIPTDPASLLNFEATTDKPPQIGQFAPGGDPVALGDAIRAYSADLALDFGISSTDVARVAANPRSGFAIALSNEGVRASQRRSEVDARRGDLDTLNKFAAMWNKLTGANLPESGWQLAYPGLPLSVEERKQRIEEWSKQAELGLASPVDLYMAINSVNRETAIKALELIAMDSGRFNGEIVATSTEPTLTQEYQSESDEPVVVASSEAPASTTALNGAQVTAAQGIVVAVASGQLPRETGINMLSSFFNLPTDQAAAIMGTVGGSFKVTPEE